MSSRYLYPAEAVGTVLAVELHPVLAQTVLQVAMQRRAAISALQEPLPLLAATGVVLPQSLHPL